MILVAGSFEELVSQICFSLASRGISIRVLILEQPDSAWVEHLKNYGTTLGVGDLLDPKFLSDLFIGVNVVICAPIFFSAEHPGDIQPGQLDLAGMLNLIDAAAAAGVRFVYLSFRDKNEDRFAQEKIKHAIKQRIIESGISFTILEAGEHLSTAMGSSNQSDQQARVKELVRLATQALKEPALENKVIQLGRQADDPNDPATIEGITGRMV